MGAIGISITAPGEAHNDSPWQLSGCLSRVLRNPSKAETRWIAATVEFCDLVRRSVFYFTSKSRKRTPFSRNSPFFVATSCRPFGVNTRHPVFTAGSLFALLVFAIHFMYPIVHRGERNSSAIIKNFRAAEVQAL